MSCWNIFNSLLLEYVIGTFNQVTQHTCICNNDECLIIFVYYLGNEASWKNILMSNSVHIPTRDKLDPVVSLTLGHPVDSYVPSAPYFVHEASQAKIIMNETVEFLYERHVV